MKKMFRQSICFAVALLLLLLLLAGCKKENNFGPGGAIQDGAAFSGSGAMEFMKIGSRAQGYAGNNGLYRVVPRENASNNFYYIEYASGLQTILCSRPECAHDNDSCNAWAPYVGGGIDPLVVGDKLLVLRLGNQDQNTIDFLGKDAIACIETADLNGANRRPSFTFAATDVVRQGFVRDEENLYFMCDSYLHVGKEGGMPTRTLLAYNIQSETVSALRPCGIMEFIVGAFEDKLVLSHTPGAENVQAPVSELETTVGLFSVRDKTFESLLTHSYEDIALVDDRMYYTFNSETGTLKGYGLEEPGQAQIQFENLFEDTLLSNYSNVTQIWDGRLMLTFEIVDKSGSEQVEGENNDIPWVVHHKQYSIDLTTGQTTFIDLYLDEGEHGIREVMIVDETEDSFLVNTSSADILVHVKEGNTTTTLGYPIFGYSFISKSDYWNSIPNYRPIETI